VAILRWTGERFGSHQVEEYRITLDEALASLLDDGPDVPAVVNVARSDQPCARFTSRGVAGEDGTSSSIAALTARPSM